MYIEKLLKRFEKEMIPMEGLEPTRPLGPPDFESGASANSATSAIGKARKLAEGLHVGKCF